MHKGLASREGGIVGHETAWPCALPPRCLTLSPKVFRCIDIRCAGTGRRRILCVSQYSCSQRYPTYSPCRHYYRPKGAAWQSIVVEPVSRGRRATITTLLCRPARSSRPGGRTRTTYIHIRRICPSHDPCRRQHAHRHRKTPNGCHRTAGAPLGPGPSTAAASSPPNPYLCPLLIPPEAR